MKPGDYGSLLFASLQIVTGEQPYVRATAEGTSAAASLAFASVC
jgi:hypothetical protein